MNISVRALLLVGSASSFTDEHALADRTYTEAFLMTFKSFTTVEELTELLIQRFRIQPPDGLTPAELEEWSKLKQKVIQIRYVVCYSRYLGSLLISRLLVGL